MPQGDSIQHGADLLKLIDEAIVRRLEALTILGNRLEGNSPGTNSGADGGLEWVGGVYSY